jgi:DnaJ-class molecular chaperone
VPQGNLTEAAKRAYRKRALEEHPDKGGAVEKMQVLTEAWEVIQKAHGVKFGSRSVRTRAV